MESVFSPPLLFSSLQRDLQRSLNAMSPYILKFFIKDTFPMTNF